MIQRILKFLNQPYPEPLRSRKSWLLILGISCIVFLILYLFQPFGLYTFSSSQKALFIAGYGLVTGITLVIFLQLFPILLKNIFSDKHWKVWKHIVWLILLVLSIGFGNVLYTSLYIPHVELSWFYILVFEGFTFAVAVIPIVLTVFFSYIQMLHKNIQAAHQISNNFPEKSENQKTTNETIVVVGNNKNERVELIPEEFIYARSEGNYVHLVYKNEDLLKQQLIRLTLSQLLTYFEKYEYIKQSHRAYIVNTNHIKKVDGNAQGLKLTLSEVAEIVPVSRSFVNNFRAKE